MNSQPDGTELSGVTVVVTRAKRQAESLISEVRRFGGRALPLPALEITPCELTDAQISLLADKTHEPLSVLVFTSSNAVLAVSDALRERGLVLRTDTELVAIGSATQAALASLGLRAQRPKIADSENLEQLPVFANAAGRRLAIVRGQGGRDVLAAGLSGLGWTVREILCYRRDVPKLDLADGLGQWRSAGRVVCIFMSGETARNFMLMVQARGESDTKLVGSTPAVVISRRVELALRSLGWTGPITVSRDTSVYEQCRAATDLCRSG